MDVEVEHPHAHHRTGHSKLDLILPIAALFVSFVSIGIAYHHGHIMQQLVEQNERLVQANSLPHLSHSIRTYSSGDQGKNITFRVANDGIGPAEIRSVELSLDGRPIRGSDDMLDRFGIPGGQLSVAGLNNAMIRPGESVEFFNLTAGPAIARQVTQMVEASQHGRFQVRICYCSVFDECWTVAGANQRPRKVDQCTAPKVPYG